MKIEYDRFGRMKYNPVFHAKHKTSWIAEDLDYLISWYDRIGPEEMSFALERPVTAVQQKVAELRKRGIMQSPIKQGYHERINPGTRKRVINNELISTSN